MSFVITCPEPLAAQAGLSIYENGGNVVDAALAGAIAQGVVNPKLCGIGGHAQIFVWLRSMKRPKWINFGPRAGLKAHERIYKYVIKGNDIIVENNENRTGYKSIMIPSFTKDIYEAHKKWGKLPWRELFQPSIKFAREGIKVYPYIIKMDLTDVNKLSFTKACAQIYTNNGKPLKVGDVLVQEDYAKTLEMVAEEGPDVFYRGEIAEKIIADFEAHGALVTEKDLKDCQPYEQDPLETTFRGYTVYENVPPTCGPIKSLALNILDHFDLKKMGWLTPEYIHTVSRALQLATIEREEYLLADPKFYPEVWDDWKTLSSREHAQEMKILIQSNREVPAAPRDMPTLYEDETTHLATADVEGNICNLKHTLGNSSGVVTPGLGFMFNNHMSSYDPRPNRRNSVGAGKFGPLGGSPTTIAKDGVPIFLSGSPAGARGSTAEAQAIIGMIDFDMTPQQAVSVPRFHADNRWGTIIVEPNFPYPYPYRKVAAMNNVMEISEYTGRLSVIKIDVKNGFIEGGADPRGGGGLGKSTKKE